MSCLPTPEHLSLAASLWLVLKGVVAGGLAVYVLGPLAEPKRKPFKLGDSIHFPDRS